VFSPGDSSVGERYPFHGELVAPPGGSRIYRTEQQTLFELDASGVDLRKATFGADIASLAFSRTGTLLAAMIHAPHGDMTVVIVRASDLREVARLPGVPRGSSGLVWSADDAYVVVGNRVIDTRTAAVVYEHGGLNGSAILFEGGLLYWLYLDLLEIVDLAKGTSTQAWLPCGGSSRAQPSAHRFVTSCGAETIVTAVGSGAPVFTRGPVGTPDSEGANGVGSAVEWAPSQGFPAVLRFSKNVRSAVLLEGNGMTVHGGELRVPTMGAPETLAARMKIGAASPIVATGVTVATDGSEILVTGAGGSVIAQFSFAPYRPTKDDIAVVGENIVVWKRGWNPTEAPSDPYVCSVAGACEAKLARVALLGLFGDELVGTRIGVSGPLLVRENVRTGRRSELPVPVTSTQLVRSEDGHVFVGLRSKPGRPKTTLFSVDAQTGKVASIVETDDPSYKTARLLGTVVDRIVLAPDFGNYAEVVLLDQRSLREKERYFLGRDATLRLRDDGSFETTGDASRLEHLVVCTDGRRFGPPARCKRDP
jgi:hypothetical protein